MSRERIAQRLELQGDVEVSPLLIKGFAGWEFSSAAPQHPMQDHSTLQGTEILTAFRNPDAPGYA